MNEGGGQGGAKDPPAVEQPNVYLPSRGQSPQQEQSDRGQCYTWAVQQSGFDPANPQVPSGPPPLLALRRAECFAGLPAELPWEPLGAP